MVHGVHDLIVHDYGPGRVMISLHAEVDVNGNIQDIHEQIDHIEHELQEKLHCSATIHMDPIVTDDEEMKSFLFSLGCYSGEPITVVSRKKKNCVVSIKDGRYNIDIELAKAILI